MSNTYITAMIDSLNKKIDVLNEIHVKNEEQLKLAKAVPFSLEDFDKNAEEKTVLIYKLNKLDEGFDLVYGKIKDELKSNKDAYKDEIRTMQELIGKITDLSVKIQAEEARNKSAMESAFKAERTKLNVGRSSVRAIKSYNQTMKAGRSYMDGRIDG